MSTDVFDLRFKFFEDWAPEPTIREIIVAYYAVDLGAEEAADCAESYIEAVRSILNNQRPQTSVDRDSSTSVQDNLAQTD